MSEIKEQIKELIHNKIHPVIDYSCSADKFETMLNRMQNEKNRSWMNSVSLYVKPRTAEQFGLVLKEIDRLDLSIFKWKKSFCLCIDQEGEIYYTYSLAVNQKEKIGSIRKVEELTNLTVWTKMFSAKCIKCSYFPMCNNACAVKPEYNCEEICRQILQALERE